MGNRYRNAFPAVILTIALWSASATSEAWAQNVTAQENRAGVDEAHRLQGLVQKAVAEHRLPAAIEEFSQQLNESWAQAPAARHVVLAELVILYGVEAELSGVIARDVADQRVETYCSELRRIAPVDRPDFLADADATCAQYWFKTRREGRALQLVAPLVTPDQPPSIRAPSAVQLAYIYEAMGRIEEAAAASALARRSYDQIGGPIRDAVQPTLLFGDMSRAVNSRDEAALRALWPRLVEMFGQRRGQKADPGTLQMIALMAYQGSSRIGADGLAQQAFAYYRSIMEQEFAAAIRQSRAPRANIDGFLREKREIELPCIQFMLGAPAQAAADPRFEERLSRCGDLLRNHHPVGIEGDLARVSAEVYEARGDNARAAPLFDQAISLAEAVRADYTVSARSYFFGGTWRYAYEGALRARARLAAASPGDTRAFFAALAATERVRARQFGDLRQVRDGASPDQLAAFAQTLRQGSVLLALSVQDSETVALAFSSDQRQVYRAPIGRVELEARVQRLHDALSDPESDPGAIDDALQSLSRDILGETQSILETARSVTVLTDGALALVPSGLLSSNAATYRPIGQTATIDFAPSLGLLMQPSPPELQDSRVLALGDPVFAEIPPAPGVSPDAAQRMGTHRGAIRRDGDSIVLNPLPGTRAEVEAIARTFGEGATTLLGSDASEGAFVRADLSRVKFLHFATHGLLPGDVPGLAEPTLVLTAGGGEDGFLTASEIEHLRIHASLTVLSACNTGSGRILAGEGVMALSRSFLLAGSRSVLATLWPVDDETTARFMQLFYGDLHAGATPSHALDRASAAIRSSSPHPYFWAPFVLVKQFGERAQFGSR